MPVALLDESRSRANRLVEKVEDYCNSVSLMRLRERDGELRQFGSPNRCERRPLRNAMKIRRTVPQDVKAISGVRQAESDSGKTAAYPISAVGNV